MTANADKKEGDFECTERRKAMETQFKTFGPYFIEENETNSQFCYVSFIMFHLSVFLIYSLPKLAESF